jgi:hypothetical protein
MGKAVTTYEEDLKTEGVRKEALSEIYERVANERGIKRIKKQKTRWILADGLSCYDHGKKTRIPKSDEDLDRVKNVGKYCTNNGLISFIDEQGRLYVGSVTQDRVKELEDAGYQRGGIWVPFSNGELPVNTRAKKNLLRMRVRSDQINAKGREKEMLDRYASIAKDRGIGKQNVSGVWLNCDNISYKTLDGEAHVFEGKRHEDRSELIGKYWMNNGVITFIDEEGNRYIGPQTPDRIKALENVGYQQRSMMVPFSNGEQAVNRVYQHKLDKLRAELVPSETTVTGIPEKKLRRLGRKGIIGRAQTKRLESENYRTKI